MLQTTLETAFDTVKKLVEDFDANKDYYLTPAYSEQAARHDFIDKFFIALGWDVNHETDKNPYEQEAHIESNVNAQGKRKRADYAFYVAPNFRDVAFYAEAKKPSVDIANADDYFQTIRYGYSSETPLAILTDFEQLHVLDCRYTPSIDTALDRFVKKYTYQDYLNKEKFAEIYYLFSREAVAGGSIEKRTLELPKARGGAVQLGLFKGGYKPIDEALLDELDGYRNTLAHAFKNGNAELDHWALTEIVQRTIDRLVFIRFLEDKLIEPEDIISNFGARNDSPWKDFVSTCRKLDKVYNGTIYKKHSILDAPDFKFDEDAFADICEKLSSKNTPYDFDKIPIHILGSIYERFLGKIITTTAKRAKVEEKPEVKKAGGVFYTPEYIVRYIVENTIGKLIEDKTPEEITGMRFADIACGSGSFLLGAYDCLIRYHASHYNKNPKQATARDCVEREGALCLTLHKKREILLNNIYGVDIDQQAVEVSQLSLYLKLLENETLGTTAASLRAESGETVLPSLNRNIQCGNSLIEPDFYVGVQEEMALYENNKEEVREINSFDWQARFPEIMRDGGFDAVIGNPPYLGGREWKESNGNKYEYFINKYKVAEYQFDMYALFWEKGISLLRENGVIGFITPNTWLNNQSNLKLRTHILQNTSIISIADYSNVSVFGKVVVLPIITILKKMIDENCQTAILRPTDQGLLLSQSVPQRLWLHDESKIINFNLRSEDANLRLRIEAQSCSLESLAEVKFGIKVYETGKGIPPQKPSDAQNHIFESNQRADSTYRKYLEGKDVNRYSIEWKKRWLKYGENLAAPRAASLFEGKRLLIRRIVGERLIGTFTEDKYVTSQLLQIVKPKNDGIAKYLLGILNSKLIAYYFKKKYNRVNKTFPEIRIYELAALPIHPVDFESVTEKSNYDRIVSLVATMTDLNKTLPQAKTDQDKTFIQRQIESADRRIDELVYELYGLTPEEIKIVEESTKN